MLQYTRQVGARTIARRAAAIRVAAIAIVTSVALGACGGDSSRADSAALGADTALNRDLALANQDSTAQPQLTDVAAPPAAQERPAAPRRTPSTSAPRRPSSSTPSSSTPESSTPKSTTTASGNTVTTNPNAKANPSASGGGAVGTIAQGTTLNASAASKICTNTNAVGDHVTATLDQAVTGTNGAVIPAGATVNLTVTQLARSENANDAIVMEFAVNSVSYGGKTYPIEGTVSSSAVERVRDQPKAKDAQKVGIGAIAGAIAGRIIGKSTKATVIGGAAGAAAGAAAAAATSNYQGCINQGGSIVVTLTAPATVRS